MKKISKKIYNEINLIDLVKIFWNGKWKIVMSIAIASIFAFIIQITQKTPEKNFTAITEIIPINSLEEYKYSAFNDYYNKIQSTTNLFDNDIGEKNFQVTRAELLNLYVEIINEKILFKKSLHEHKFLDIKEYANKGLYYDAIEKIAASIKVYIPKPADIKVKEQIVYTIRFNYNDEKKWKKILTTVNTLTNQAVKQNLKKKFRVLLLSEKIRKQYVLEDTVVSIKNLLEDYETKTINKISYLKEQAAIAKKL